ncbi:MAG TPA: PfkB family carbohydrate kinase [archaeon]|nr:PfkB family carbohydrate kinase [archaeon]
MVDVVVIGSLALDDVSTPFGTVKGALGGSATYASIACSLFSSPGVVGVVGSDFPQKYIDQMKSKGVDLRGLEIEKGGKTFRWSGEYGLDLNSAKTLKTELNVFEKFDPKIPSDYAGVDFLFLGNIDPSLQLDVLSKMKKRPKLVVADTMNLWIEKKREEVLEVVEQVDVALMNDAEARELFRTSSIVKAAREILKRDSEVAIIKKGEHGCVLFTDSSYFACPGYPLENVKDPTGAGDSFGGSLIGYLAKTQDFSFGNMKKGIVYASSVASFNAEGFSVQRLCEINMRDVTKRYGEFSEFVKF